MNLKFTHKRLFLFFHFMLIAFVVSATGGEKGSKSSVVSSNQYPADNKLSAGVIFWDDMNGANDTTSLMSRGYYVYYRGTGSQGTSALWYQGVPAPAVFNAYSGPDSGYVAANYNIVTGNNTIDSWLVLPDLNISQGDTLSFWSRSPDNSTYPDSIRVMYSAAGDILPEATSWVELGRFKVSTSGWSDNTFIAPAAGSNARFAIRYRVMNGGPQGTNSDYIGIDEIMVTGPSGTGINELEKASITISPNPANDFLNLMIKNFSGNLVSISIFSALGQQVKSFSLAKGGSEINSNIDISDLQKGIYFISIANENDKITRKIIIE